MGRPRIHPLPEPKIAKGAVEAVDIAYIPREGDPSSVIWGGMKFVANVPRSVNNPKIIQRAKANPWFQVTGEKRAAVAPSAPPTTAEEYCAHAIAYINVADNADGLMQRWNEEETLREACGVGSDDLEKIGGFYNPKLEKLRKAEAA